MTPAARKRLCRRRERDGLGVFVVVTNAADLSYFLAARGFLDEAGDHDSKSIGAALTRFLEAEAKRVLQWA